MPPPPLPPCPMTHAPPPTPRYLHALDLAHRDLKPSNVLLKSSPGDARGFTAKLSDFGLAKITYNDDEEQVSTVVIPCAPPYVPPEYSHDDEGQVSTLVIPCASPRYRQCTSFLVLHLYCTCGSALCTTCTALCTAGWSPCIPHD